MTRASILIAILLAPMIAASEETTYAYVGGFGDELIYIKQRADAPSGKIGFGDSLGPAELCEEDSEFICLFSQSYAFAVPKTMDRDQDTWTVRGETFELVERGVSVSLLGMELKGLMLIRSPASATLRGQRTNNDELYLYSYEAVISRDLDPTRPPVFSRA